MDTMFLDVPCIQCCSVLQFEVQSIDFDGYAGYAPVLSVTSGPKSPVCLSLCHLEMHCSLVT